MEIEGLIISDLGQKDGISKAGNPWKKHEWLLETTGQYPRKVKFTVFGERVNTITFECGKRYIIQVDAESREYNGNWYTDLTAYSCRQVESTGQETGPNFGQPQAPQAHNSFVGSAPAPQNPFGGNAPIDITQDDNDNLPF